MLVLAALLAATPVEETGHVEEREFLNISVEVPAGWKAIRHPSAISLHPEPWLASIDLGYYEPHNDCQYSDWTAWTRRKLRRLAQGATIRRRRSLVVDGHRALQLEWVEGGQPWRTIVETWIARPEPEAPKTGEVFVVLLDGADGPSRAAYARVLASLRFLR